MGRGKVRQHRFITAVSVITRLQLIPRLCFLRAQRRVDTSGLFEVLFKSMTQLYTVLLTLCMCVCVCVCVCVCL